MSEPTVFIVDDDDAVLDSIAELVTSVGLRAATFRSAQEFRASFNPEQPGCLVLDVRMAHISGPALQDELNAIGARIPIVFISGHATSPSPSRRSKPAPSISFRSRIASSNCSTASMRRCGAMPRPGRPAAAARDSPNVSRD